MRFVQVLLGPAVLCLVAGVAGAQQMISPMEMGGRRTASGDLTDLIGSTVAPNTWDTVGGPGSMAPFDSNLSLVVGQTQEVHEEIVDLLEQLRRMQDLQVTVEVPFRTVSDSFYEKMGVGSWSGNIKGMPFSIGGGEQAIPQFGGYDPSAGLKTGIAFMHRDSTVEFPNIELNQGYRQTAVTQSPKVTLFNGQRAYVSDTSQSPFVISVIPVVGGYQVLPIPPMACCYVPTRNRAVLPVTSRKNPRVEAMWRKKLAEQQKKDQKAGEDEYFRHVEDPNRPRRIAIKPEKVADREQSGDLNLAGPARTAVPATSGRKLASSQASSAGRAVPSVAEARRMHEAEQAKGDKEARIHYEQGLAAEESGKPRVAKIYYDMAARRATGQLRAEILARLDALALPQPRE